MEDPVVLFLKLFSDFLLRHHFRAVIEYEPMKSKETKKLGQEIILSQQSFRVVCIERLKIILCDVLLLKSLLKVVLLQDGVLDKV